MKPQVSTVFMQVVPGEHIETVDSFESYRGHTKRCPLTCTNRLRGHVRAPRLCASGPRHHAAAPATRTSRGPDDRPGERSIVCLEHSFTGRRDTDSSAVRRDAPRHPEVCT